MVWVVWLRRVMGRQGRFENFRIGPTLSNRIESNRNGRFEFESNLEASQVPSENVDVVVVCSASIGDVHAGQVPARLHVSAQRADAPRPSVHRHTARLSYRAVRHQGDRHHLHRLSSHGEHASRSSYHIITNHSLPPSVVDFSSLGKFKKSLASVDLTRHLRCFNFWS